MDQRDRKGIKIDYKGKAKLKQSEYRFAYLKSCFFEEKECNPTIFLKKVRIILFSIGNVGSYLDNQIISIKKNNNYKYVDI